MTALIDLAAGAPDIETPAVAAAAAKRAIDRGHTRYTGAAGIPELRRAIVDDVDRRRGVRFDADDVMVSAGAKLTLFCVLSALASGTVGPDAGERPPGRTVVHPTPHYGGYPGLIARAGLTARRIETSAENGYKLTPELLGGVVDADTVAVLLNAPGNPTGVMYDVEELEALARVIRARSSAVIVSDEIYSRFAYDQPYVSPAALASVADRVVIVDGVSKAFGMTGWRLGYAVGPGEIIRAARRVNTELANCASSISQWAAVAALESAPEDHLDLGRHERLRDIAFSATSALPGATGVRPAGGIYQAIQLNAETIARLRAEPGTVAQRLAALGGVRVPNDATFGRPGLLRITFSLPEQQLVDGFGRLADALTRLRTTP